LDPDKRGLLVASHLTRVGALGLAMAFFATVETGGARLVRAVRLGMTD